MFYLKIMVIGRSENKTVTKFLSYENEARPGVVMIGAIFFCLREVNPSTLGMMVKFDCPVL